MTPGAKLTNEIREAVSRVGARLFVMSSGRFWAGRVVGRTDSGDIILRNARQVTVGFEGLSDLLGYTPVTITADMVGQTVAVFSTVEVKAGSDRPTPKQVAFCEAVNRAGGRSGVARSINDALGIVRPQG